MMKERRYVLRNGLVFDTKENKKMYPVGKWNKYQHVFYNYMDRCFNSMCDSKYDKKESDKYEKSQELAESGITTHNLMEWCMHIMRITK